MSRKDDASANSTEGTAENDSTAKLDDDASIDTQLLVGDSKGIVEDISKSESVEKFDEVATIPGSPSPPLLSVVNPTSRAEVETESIIQSEQPMDVVETGADEISAVEEAAVSADASVEKAEVVDTSEEVVPVVEMHVDVVSDLVEEVVAQVAEEEEAPEQELQEAKEEVTTPLPSEKAKGRKKKLKSEASTDDLIAVLASDENTPRYQSHRAAAMVAKTKLNARGSKGGESKGGVEKSSSQQMDEGGVEEPVIKPETASKRKDKAEKIEKAVVAPEPLNWVMCERCSKWRSLAPDVKQEELPEVWYCEYNTWNHRNTCEVPDETEEAEQQLKEQQQAQASSRKSRIGSVGDEADALASARKVKSRYRRATSHDEFRDDDSDGDFMDARRAKTTPATEGGAVKKRAYTKSLNSSKGSATALSAPVANWVQCNKCKKWRTVPEGIDVGSLPEKWFCSLNSWNPLVARCSAKEEQDESATAAAGFGAFDAQPPRGTMRGNNRRNSSQSLNAMSSPVVPPGGIKKVNWVQCERRNCRKWRKVPGYIDMDSLPEKWYCALTTWDQDMATCDAPETSDEENDQPHNSDTRSQLILSNPKGPGTLSYRRIIFGNDGKLRACFSEKNRNGYGIFSYTESQKAGSEAEAYHEPVRRVNYWWSSAYNEKAATVVHAKTKKPAKNAPVVPEPVEVAPQVKKADPYQPTYLLDAARRIYGMANRSSGVTLENVFPLHDLEHKFEKLSVHPKKLDKLSRDIAALSIFDRLHAECVAVRSCFLASPTKIVTLPALQELLKKSKFLDRNAELVRSYMFHEVPLRAAIRRLEEKNQVSVTVSSAGVLCVELLKATHTLMPFYVDDCVRGIHPAYTAPGIPLKLRKFNQQPIHEIRRHRFVPMKTERELAEEQEEADGEDEVKVEESQKTQDASQAMDVDDADGEEEAAVNAFLRPSISIMQQAHMRARVESSTSIEGMGSDGNGGVPESKDGTAEDGAQEGGDAMYYEEEDEAGGDERDVEGYEDEEEDDQEGEDMVETSRSDNMAGNHMPQADGDEEEEEPEDEETGE